MNHRQQFYHGFTLIELLIVIAIIGILAGVVLVSLNQARQESRVAAALVNQQSLRKAVELYVSDMGFYAPDVNRGWDPGFAKPLPYNSDTGEDCNINPGDCPACSQCPASWQTIVQQNWRGPYIADWPKLNPWNGKYDYNYWVTATDRYGCIVPAGVYIGVLRDYADQNPIPADAEQKFLDKLADGDECINGEAQLLLDHLS